MKTIYNKKNVCVKNFILITTLLIALIIFPCCDFNNKKIEDSNQTKNGINIKKNQSNDRNKSKILINEEEFVESVFSDNVNDSDFVYKAIKRKREVIYELSKNNPDSLGLIYVPSPVSIESIIVINDYAYLTDNANGNIKRICVNTGKIESSKQFNREDYFFEEMTYFNDLLYVVTHQGKMFKFTKNLEFIGSFNLDGGIYLKYLLPDNSDNIKVFQYPSPFVFNIEDKGCYMRRILVDKNNIVTYDTVYVGKGEYALFELRKKMQGKIINENDKLFYFVNDTKYEILDYFEFYNWGRNIYYDDNKLVFFEISREEKKFYLHVYEY